MTELQYWLQYWNASIKVPPGPSGTLTVTVCRLCHAPAVGELANGFVPVCESCADDLLARQAGATAAELYERRMAWQEPGN